MKTYGLYINPFPGIWFYPSRLKREAYMPFTVRCYRTWYKTMV